MAQTPTDPTKAQVWITGTPPNQSIEFYFPSGQTGAPGGLTAGGDLAQADLNTITAPGLYRQANTAYATLATNYPVAGANGSGTLMVIQQGLSPAGGLTQIYYPNWDAAKGRAHYVRVWYNSAWLPWYSMRATRTDQTAGRAIYEWDDLNNREQLVYGDTGMRDIYADAAWSTALFPTGVTPNSANLVRLRRTGYTVELVWACDKAASGGATATTGFPTGFRPANPFHVLGANSGMTLARAYNGGGAALMGYNSTAAVPAFTMSTTFTTTDPWPTTLPGAAIGSVSNV